MSAATDFVSHEHIIKLWGGSPFDATAALAESTLALLAGGALHPTPAVREACQRAVNKQIGAQAVKKALEKVRVELSRYSDDLLEPLLLEDGDHWLVAALQLLRARHLPKDRSPLRITSLDTLGVGGGVDLNQLDSSARVQRRTTSGGWNNAVESAYHPALLRGWVTNAASSQCVRLNVGADADGISIEIPHDKSGADRLHTMLERGAGFPAPKWFEQWLLAGNARLPQKPSTPGAGGARVTLISHAQRYSRLTVDSSLLSSAGGHVTGTESVMRIQIKRPEAIIRFSAAALKPGLIEIASVRPLGWLVLGRGIDEIDFVRASNALPPIWLQYAGLPRLVPPSELVQPLADWIGPSVGLVDFELLDALRG